MNPSSEKDSKLNPKFFSSRKKTDDSFNSEADESSENCSSEIINESQEENETKTQTQIESEDNSLHSNLSLISSITKTLTVILNENKEKDNKSKKISSKEKIFTSNKIPKISLYDYLVRIQTYTNMEKSSLILSLIYIDKLCEFSGILLSFYNIHRILFGAVLLAIKNNEDNYYDNKYYSEIAGISLKELNMIEYNFLEMTEFNVFIEEETYKKYYRYLMDAKDDKDDDN